MSDERIRVEPYNIRVIKLLTLVQMRDLIVGPSFLLDDQKKSIIIDGIIRRVPSLPAAVS